MIEYLPIGREIYIPSNAKVMAVNEYNYEMIIGIGKDHVAYLRMDKEAFEALQSGEKVTYHPYQS